MPAAYSLPLETESNYNSALIWRSPDVRTFRLLAVLPVCLLALLVSVSADAATRTVCASGCMYTSLQTAVSAALRGDTLLLRAGETFAGNIVLPNKSGAGSITIRSDAPDAQLPAAGVRLVPSGRTGANTA